MENKVVPERIEISLPAKLDYVSIARLTISGVAHRMGFSIDVLEDLKLCVSEACANSILHAYPESDRSFQTVTICCELYTVEPLMAKATRFLRYHIQRSEN
ncbi:hypothetical protein EEL31_20880 [Brevibacillus laterosporus]|nr:ATP-binding protein [Brevibacillus laterosporus]TPG70676.1 hypothetical protein EEL31_20880 [Brevibacillus laterosporus]